MRFAVVLWQVSLVLLLTGRSHCRADDEKARHVFCLTEALPARKPPESDQHFTMGNLLHRELMRQAVLMTAREAFGMATRDAMLREPLPADSADERLFHLDTEILNKAHDELTLRWKNRVLFTTKLPWNYGTSPYIQVADRACELTEKQLVEALGKAGLTPKPRPVPSTKAEVPDRVSQALERMDLVSQFQAVRLAHSAMAKYGESLALLAALTRGYAHLGQLTALHPCNMRHAFGARSILYATRMIRLEPDSPVGYWHRAYAFALLGHSFASLEDLRLAGDRRKNQPKVVEPEWLPALDASNRYQYEVLGEFTKATKRHAELGALLCYRSVELSDSPTLNFGVGESAMVIAPNCLRVYDGMTRAAGVITGHRYTEQAFDLHGRVLEKTLLPLLKASKSVAKSFGDAAEWIRSVNGRAKLAQALTDHAGIDHDLREPSLAVLGRLVDDANVLQIARRGVFLKHYLAIDAGEFIEGHVPAFERHPHGPLIRALGLRVDQRDELATTLATFECAQSNITCMYELLRSCPPNTLFKGMSSNEYFQWQFYLVSTDEIDYLFKTSLLPDQGKLQTANWMATIHPHSPFRITTQIRLNWPDAKGKADQWLSEYGRHPAVVLAFAERFDADGDSKRAEQLYRSVVNAVPDADAYERLIEFLWNVKRDSNAAMELAQEFFEQPDYGLSHASLAQNIAYELMTEDKADAALPWAERAADSYSTVGLQSLADCYERLGKYDESLDILRKIDERYHRFSRYAFAARTGRGDLDAVLRVKLDVVARYFGPESIELQFAKAMHPLFQDKPEDAVKLLRPLVNVEERNWLNYWVAAVADRTGDGALRDSMWKQAVEANVNGNDPAAAHQAQLWNALGNALLDASSTDTPNHDELKRVATPDPVRGSPMAIRLFVACWYEARGDKERALEFYRQTARLPSYDEPEVIYAWQRMRVLGDDPKKLTPLWQGLPSYVERAK